jgi:hypothetical protein
VDRLGWVILPSWFSRKVVGRIKGDLITASIIGPIEVGRSGWAIPINHTNSPILKAMVEAEGTGPCLVGEMGDRMAVVVVRAVYFGALGIAFLPSIVYAAIRGVGQDQSLIPLVSVLSLAVVGAIQFLLLRRQRDSDAVDLLDVLAKAIKSEQPRQPLRRPAEPSPDSQYQVHAAGARPPRSGAPVS